MSLSNVSVGTQVKSTEMNPKLMKKPLLMTRLNRAMSMLILAALLRLGPHWLLIKMREGRDSSCCHCDGSPVLH